MAGHDWHLIVSEPGAATVQTKCAVAIVGGQNYEVWTNDSTLTAFRKSFQAGYVQADVSICPRCFPEID